MVVSSTLISTFMIALAPLGIGGQKSKVPSIGPQFHRETSFGTPRLTDSATPGIQPTVKLHAPDSLAVIKLPAPIESNASLYQALLSRRSIRAYKKTPVPLQSISNLLWAANGLTGADGGFSHRTTPSAGALYPLEIYLVAFKVDSLAPGLYHYHQQDSTLEKRSSGDHSQQLFRAGLRQDPLSSPPCAIIITACFDRTTRKYADRGYRYVYMEAGAAFQNISLEAAACGLGTVVIGAFDDAALNDLLGIDGTTEAALVLMPVGCPR